METLQPEPLERRPEARAIRVEDLLAEVKRGRIRIPKFQRGMKWEREDALKLLDSIYRGYPVGTLLLWETHAESQQLHFGPIAVAASARPDAWWVVDGQQRVVSLVRVLLADHPSTDDFALFFDLDELTFTSASGARSLRQDPPRWLPLDVALDSEQLFQWVFDQVPAPERRERAVRLGKRVREYDIPVYVVHTGSEETLREIFGRSNSSGKRLEATEVFDALHGARSSSRPASLSDIVDELAELGFGRIEQKILYRLLRVLTGADVAARAGRNVLRLNDEDAQRAYAATASASREVVQFIKRDVGIAHYELLPYKQPLVTLGKFFHHHPTPSRRSRELLVRWLWRGALDGTHRGDTVSTRRALDQIDGSEEQSVQRMLKQVAAVPVSWPSSKEPFNFRFANGKLQALALIDLGPRDFADGALLPVSQVFDRKKAGADIPIPELLTNAHGGLEHTMANRLIHPKRAGLRRLIAATENEAVLGSHGISPSAKAALTGGRWAEFLRLRAATLDSHFGHFFARRARWAETDRPSVGSLVLAEGD